MNSDYLLEHLLENRLHAFAHPRLYVALDVMLEFVLRGQVLPPHSTHNLPDTILQGTPAVRKRRDLGTDLSTLLIQPVAYDQEDLRVASAREDLVIGRDAQVRGAARAV